MSDDQRLVRSRATDGGRADSGAATEVTEEGSPEQSDGPGLQRSERLAAAFWLLLGLVVLGGAIPVFGREPNVVVPGLLLVGYGLFVLWNPHLASRDDRWTGVFWILLGLVTLATLNFVDLYWTYEVSGALIGLFLVGLGMLVVLDL